MQPDHVELASAQYHGWAFLNREAIMPTPQQIECAQRAIFHHQRVSDSNVYYVLPDVFANRAKPCHQGWGSTYFCVNPQGDVMPCLSAHTLPSLQGCTPNVRTSTMQEIWDGPVFAKYQGLEWMTEEHAKTHPRRREDLGGCRCQAYLMTGDECAMDPVDDSSIHHLKFLEDMKNAYRSVQTAFSPRRH